MCVSFIRRLVSRSSLGSILTSRDFLSYGSRAAVDQAASRLVKSGFLIRVARGVFVRWDSPVPSVLEVAEAKARSFCKSIVKHGADISREIGLSKLVNPQTTFYVNGRSSSFRFGEKTIRFQGIAQRKVPADKGRVGTLITALWHLGRAASSQSTAWTAIENFGRPERNELCKSFSFMPSWMVDYFSLVRIFHKPSLLSGRRL